MEIGTEEPTPTQIFCSANPRRRVWGYQITANDRLTA